MYSAKNLERGLKLAAKAFLASENEAVVGGPSQEGRGVLRTSKIFEWYGVDFAGFEKLAEEGSRMGGNEGRWERGIYDWMVREHEGDGRLWEPPAGFEFARLEFAAYDWSLNGTE